MLVLNREKPPNYNAFRAMAANIRSLHSCYCGSNKFSSVLQQQIVVEAASLSCYQMESKTHKIKGPPLLNATSSDGNLAVLLHWATASHNPVYWSDVMGCTDYSKGRKGVQSRIVSRGSSLDAVISTPRSTSVGTAR